MKKGKLEYVLTFVLVFFMVSLAELCHEKEIIFPEITALAIGAWLAKQMVWKTSKTKAVCLMALMSVSGVVFVRYVPLCLALKVNLAFIWCAICLIFSRTSFAPLISACILPILLGTNSWIYPLSATLMTVVVMMGLTLLEKLKIKAPIIYEPVTFNGMLDVKLWLKRWLFVSVMIVLATTTKINLLIAPPLMVVFVELSGDFSKLKTNWKKILMMVTICAFVSALSRYLLCMLLDWPLITACVVATLTLLYCIQKFQVYFPPVGAIAILPLLIAQKQVLIYPFALVIGCILFMLGAYFIAKPN